MVTMTLVLIKKSIYPFHSFTHLANGLGGCNSSMDHSGNTTKSSSSSSSSLLYAVVLSLLLAVVLVDDESAPLPLLDCCCCCLPLWRHPNKPSSCPGNSSFVGDDATAGACLSSSSNTKNDFCRIRTFHCKEHWSEWNQSHVEPVRATVVSGFWDAVILTWSPAVNDVEEGKWSADQCQIHMAHVILTFQLNPITAIKAAIGWSYTTKRYNNTNDHCLWQKHGSKAKSVWANGSHQGCTYFGMGQGTTSRKLKNLWICIQRFYTWHPYRVSSGACGCSNDNTIRLYGCQMTFITK